LEKITQLSPSTFLDNTSSIHCYQ